jgi:hypothetical protein
VSVATRLPAILNEVGITRKQLIKALADSVVVKEAVIRKTKEVQQYWISITPITDRKAHPIQKGSDVIIHPGDAKASIKIRYRREPLLVGVVYVDEKIAPHYRWLEYGSIHNPVFGYRQKVEDHFQGVESV